MNNAEKQLFSQTMLVTIVVTFRNHITTWVKIRTSLDKVMSGKQWHIAVQESYLVFKGSIQLNYNVLVFTYFYAMATMFQFV